MAICLMLCFRMCEPLSENPAIRQRYVAFPLMCVGLYIAETPDTRCLFGKTPALSKTPVYYHNVAHSNPISCCGPINIFKR